MEDQDDKIIMCSLHEEMEQLDRKQAQITGAAAREASASQQKAESISSGIGAVGNITSAVVAKGKKGE